MSLSSPTVAHGSSATQQLSHQAATGQVSITTSAKVTPEPAHLVTSESSHLTAASEKDALEKESRPQNENKPVSVDSEEEEEEEEEDILRSSMEGDEVGKLLRTTVSELETALQVLSLQHNTLMQTLAITCILAGVKEATG